MHINNWTNARLLLSPDGNDGGNDEEVRNAGFQKMAERYRDDVTGMAKELYADNFQLRRKNNELSGQISDLKTRVPTEGSAVLSPQEAQDWAAYKALGTPTEIKTAVDERVTLQGKMDSMAREATIRDVASTAGFVYDVLLDADMLAQSKAGKKLSYLVKEVETDGVKSKVAYVKDGDTETPLSTYAEENWPKLMPSLVVKEESSSQSRPTGIYYPAQHQGTGGGNKPVTARQQVEATLANQYSKSGKKT